MSILDTAMDRFARAVDQLETSINRRSVKIQSSERFETEVAALRSDRARLAEELDAMRAQTRQLTALNVRASGQLAGAIDELNRVLAVN